ncbi:MAG: 2'-5' RNA ligase [Candidatus Daviesbacteria bacterium GW2011_GWB1_41_5]|uniref:2'-5' RNA ligase n=2 Tax=Candidatus Daviesiibacteriota TaxID=1752718 RepID=A0A0G0WET5_9BACT|nr:MAG: 2'-5' RNA ligase [Candidatus Daviesbacteria bacterium GW2011_GWB1_41_5]
MSRCQRECRRFKSGPPLPKITMLYALVFRPKIDTSKIDEFRRKYDPHINLIGPHITPVFPISGKNIDKNTFLKHIKNVLKGEKPFKIHLQGLRKSWDQWLNLILKKGNSEVIALHDKLYTGVLTQFFRKDLGYIPHIGLGLFVSSNSGYKVTDPTLQKLDENKYKLAFKEAESLSFDYWTDLDNLELITLDDNATQIVEQERFILNNN